jgi:hypothetical protein
MLNEMNQELAEKTAEHSKLSLHLEPLHVSEEFIAAVKYDIQTMIALLDADAPNPQMLHTLAGKFITNLFIQRETRKLYLTIQFRNDDMILYEKTIVANWE